ncbi:MAG: hypothetical protein D6681_05055 [Calditrichaeota bacterium]|nr:MAG: hypothetical protein D6681_05055 [Calditrichota bacterium]
MGAALAHPRGWGARHRIIGVEWVPKTSQMVTWSSDSTLKVWQVFSPPSPDPSASAPAIDFDLPAELISLEVMALTGTVYNPETHTVEELPPDRWRVIRERYRKAGEKHFRKCRYPAANRWAPAFGR